MNEWLLQLPADDEEMDQEEADEAARRLGEPPEEPQEGEEAPQMDITEGDVFPLVDISLPRTQSITI